MELICNQPKYLPSVDIIVMVVAGTGVVACVVEPNPFNCNDSFMSLDYFWQSNVLRGICNHRLKNGHLQMTFQNGVF